MINVHIDYDNFEIWRNEDFLLISDNNVQDAFHPERKTRFDAREVFQPLAVKLEKQILQLTGFRLLMGIAHNLSGDLLKICLFRNAKLAWHVLVWTF